MDRETLERLDSFPYRHVVADVMTSPVVLASAGDPLVEAVRRMDVLGISSVLVEDGAEGVAVGIVTERDVLNAVSRHGPAGLDLPLRAVMSSPVHAVTPDALVHVAIGRMDRLGIRHLQVVDDGGRAVGVLTARTLLRQRARQALALGDEVAVAGDAEALGRIRGALAPLAGALLREGVAATDVAAVIAGVMRDCTGRAAALAAEALEHARGPAPAPWCALILGSGGRGESLLAPDQDNALVHAGRPGDDPWFAELGERMCSLLDRAGIPCCKGGVMAMNPAWRHSVEEWGRLVDHWVAMPEGESLLNVDIFFDFHPVHGDRQLASALRELALGKVRHARIFLKSLAGQLAGAAAPVGLFGRFRLSGGRIDLKLGGIWPAVAGARVLALRRGVEATSTLGRLDALSATGALPEADVQAMRDLYGTAIRLMLDQQIADIAAGRVPGARVDPRRLSTPDRARLRRVLKQVDRMVWTVEEALDR
jgi:CBS domain-containing protein